MNNTILQYFLVVLSVIVASACSSIDDVLIQYPYISGITNTDCLSSLDVIEDQSLDVAGKSMFEMTISGTTATCKFTSLYYPCDFGHVNINVTYGDRVMTIVEYPSSDLADCRCMTDVTFTIENIPDSDFILKIYHGSPTGAFNVDAPCYSGLISHADGGLSILY